MKKIMNDIDKFITATISKMTQTDKLCVSTYHIDLKTYQPRVTERLVANTIKACHLRGVEVEIRGKGAIVTVDLKTCYMNPPQVNYFNTHFKTLTMFPV